MKRKFAFWLGGRTEDDEKGTSIIFTKEIIYNVRKPF